MATIAAPKSTADGGAKTDAKSTAQLLNPFTRASRRETEPFYDNTIALTASAQTLQQIDVPSGGYLRHIVLDVVLSGTTGATYNADAPYNVLEQVQITDVNGQALVQLSGFDLMLANLLGGYSQHADPAAYPGYSKGATGASFQLRIPIEIVSRNALGCLQNMNASMTYKVKATLAPINAVYASNGTGASVRIRATVERWAQPNSTDIRGNGNMVAPPQIGTTQNWSEYVAPTSVGQNTIRFPRVGNTLRNLVLVNRDASGARTEANLPSELAIFMDGKQWHRNTFAYEIQRMYELYGYTTNRPTGVWVVCLTDDFDGTPGDEQGEYWLPTSGATRLEIQGTWVTNPGTLTVLTNDILAFGGASGPGQTLGVNQ